MKAPAALLRCLAVGALPHLGAALEARQRVTPVQKVVQLLEGMVAKAKEEKHQEQVQYAGFEQFCVDVSSEKQQSLAKAEEQHTLMDARLQKAEAEAERLAAEIEVHNGEIATITADMEAAAVARKAEEEAYLAMHQNFTESVEAIAKALSTLKSQNYERAGEMPAALLQEEPDLTFLPDVPTTAYKPKSADLITMLEGLQGKFRTKVEDLDKEEVKRKHAAEMLAQDHAGAMAAAEDSVASKSKSRARHLQEAEQLTSDLQELAKAIEEMKAYLTELTALCAQKADEYKARQGTRAEEIAALEKAIEIMSSSEVSAAAQRRTASTAGAALLQLRGDGSPEGQARAAAFLLGESSRLRSSVLSAVVSQLRDDPLAKVKILIQELIDRLKTEALRETEHKGWCDKELATNAHTRTTKTQEIEGLRIDIDSLQADLLELKKDLSQLSVSMNETQGAMANATQLRAAEQAENEAAIADARAGQAAVSDAVKVLQDFYANATKQPASLAQVRRGAQTPPPIFEDGTYTGQQGESGGVLAMLDIIKSDFARIEADATAAEAAAQREHDKFMEESRVSMAQMETDTKHKAKAQQDNEVALEDKKEDLQKVEEVLATAEAEYDKLKPPCMGEGQTYEERVALRKDEIEALKEALAILSGEA